MKIAVVADPHSNLIAFQEVMNAIRERGIPTVLLAGDLVGYGPYPNEVVELVSSSGVTAIRGNHDEAVISRDFRGLNPFAAMAARWTSEVIAGESLRFLERLPESLSLRLGGRRIGLHHGSPEDPYEYVESHRRAEEILGRAESDVVIAGHTHVPMLTRRGEGLFLNPGGVGQPRDGNPCASFAELDLESLEATLLRVAYDISAVQERMVSVGLPRYLAARLSGGR